MFAFAVSRREREWRHTVVVPDVDLCAGADELRGGVCVLCVSGPMERGSAVGLRGIDVSLLRQQCLHCLFVLALRGVGKRRRLCRSRSRNQHARRATGRIGSITALPGRVAPVPTTMAASDSPARSFSRINRSSFEP